MKEDTIGKREEGMMKTRKAIRKKGREEGRNKEQEVKEIGTNIER